MRDRGGCCRVRSCGGGRCGLRGEGRCVEGMGNHSLSALVLLKTRVGK